MAVKTTRKNIKNEFAFWGGNPESTICHGSWMDTELEMAMPWSSGHRGSRAWHRYWVLDVVKWRPPTASAKPCINFNLAGNEGMLNEDAAWKMETVWLEWGWEEMCGGWDGPPFHHFLLQEADGKRYPLLGCNAAFNCLARRTHKKTITMMMKRMVNAF